MVWGAHLMPLDGHIVHHTRRNKAESIRILILPLENDSDNAAVRVIHFHTVGVPGCVLGYGKGGIQVIKQKVILYIVPSEIG